MLVFFQKQHAVTCCPTTLDLSSKYQHIYVSVCAWNWACVDPQSCGVCLPTARHAQQDEFAEPHLKMCFSSTSCMSVSCFTVRLFPFSAFSMMSFLQNYTPACKRSPTHLSLQRCCVCTLHDSACTSLWIMPINLPCWRQMASHSPVSQTRQHFISDNPSHQQPVRVWWNRDATCDTFQCACVTLLNEHAVWNNVTNCSILV